MYGAQTHVHIVTYQLGCGCVFVTVKVGQTSHLVFNPLATITKSWVVKHVHLRFLEKNL